MIVSTNKHNAEGIRTVTAGRQAQHGNHRPRGYVTLIFSATIAACLSLLLQVHPNPIPALADTYRSTLSLVQKNLPDNSAYRQSLEALTQHRLAIVEAAESSNAVDKVEQEIGQGQIEEVIVAAKNELKLVAKIIEWKA